MTNACRAGLFRLRTLTRCTLVLSSLLHFAGCSGNGRGAVPAGGTDGPLPDTPLAQQPPPEPSQVVQLPLEVLGPEGFTRAVPLRLGAEDAARPLTLWMQVHGLTHEGKGSVRLNTGAWTPLSNQTVTVEGLGRAYGGIGGGFGTLKLRLALPAGVLREGDNAVAFRLDASDGHSIGFRVLRLNLLREDGSPVLPASAFREEDPSTWQPPLPDADAIAEGARLWHTRQLRRNDKTAELIRARCQDCHAQDGRDLKYFNYSNHAIIERAKFHGLTEEEGKKVASYIRTLPGVPAPGRPWNPPYQPGPGLDARPVEEWAAGAGVDAVLERDRDMLPALFPHGISAAAVATTGNLSVREVPIALQLPDWNHWLPTVHPMDAWGDDFVNSKVNEAYAGGGTARGGASSMRESAARVKAAGYGTYRSELFALHRDWNLSLYAFLSPRYPTAAQAQDTGYARQVYATALWHMVKMWEVMQEFGLEGHQQQLFPSSRDARGWMANNSFETSPHLLKLPRDNTGINGNSPLMFTYFSAAWYQLALTLFNGNHADGADRDGQRPIDWGYSHGFVKDLRQQAIDQPPTNALLSLWLIKGMQVADNGLKPSANVSAGWATQTAADLSRLVVPENQPGWSDTRPEERRAVLEALLSAWWDKTRQFATSDWYGGNNDGAATPSEVLDGNYDGSMGNRIWYMLPHFKYLGVDPSLVDAIADWGQTVWPGSDWRRVKEATCAQVAGRLRCTHERD